MAKIRAKGTGHITQVEPSLWKVEVTKGRRPDGKKRRVYELVEGTRLDAERRALAISAEMGNRPNLGQTMTANDYFHAIWAETRAPLLANATRKRYESVWRNHIGPSIGAMQADEINRAVVQMWLSTMAPPMAREAHKVLKAVLRCMWDDELLDEEPMRRAARLPECQEAMVDAWSEAEALEAMDRLRGTRMEPLWLAIVGAGLRREEALAVHVPDDLKFEPVLRMDGEQGWSCRIVVDKALTRHDGLKDTKTHRTRAVTVAEPFASRLKECVDGMAPGGLMRNVDGSDMKPGSVPGAWKRLFRPGGPLDGMRFVKLYTGRHTHETAASRAGVPDSLNARIHGHSKNVAFDHYIVRTQDDADACAEAVGEVFASKVERTGRTG